MPDSEAMANQAAVTPTPPKPPSNPGDATRRERPAGSSWTRAAPGHGQLLDTGATTSVSLAPGVFVSRARLGGGPGGGRRKEHFHSQHWGLEGGAGGTELHSQLSRKAGKVNSTRDACLEPPFSSWHAPSLPRGSTQHTQALGKGPSIPPRSCSSGWAAAFRERAPIPLLVPAGSSQQIGPQFEELPEPLTTVGCRREKGNSRASGPSSLMDREMS